MTISRIENADFEKQQLHAKGRNGFMKCRGVEVATLFFGDNNIVHINPITSHGTASDAARIEIPATAIPRMIAVLKSAYSEHLAREAEKESNLLNNFVCPQCHTKGGIEEQVEDCIVTTNLDLMVGANSVDFGDQDVQADGCGHFYCTRCGHNLQTEEGEAITSLDELEEYLTNLGGTK